MLCKSVELISLIEIFYLPIYTYEDTNSYFRMIVISVQVFSWTTSSYIFLNDLQEINPIPVT